MIKKIDKRFIFFYRILPFTYIGMVRSVFGELLKTKSNLDMLDLGCGDGTATYNLDLPKNFKITGVEIFKPYLPLAKEKGIYAKILNKDVRKITTRDESDIVLAAHILEHLTKEEGRKFLKQVENLARKKIIIIVPIEDNPQEMYDKNQYQEHKSSWKINEMRKRGYKIKSHGLKLLWGNNNVVQKYKIFSYFLFIISDLFYPLLSIRPELGTYMICVKDK